MSKSEIFDNFLKIALEKGLINNAEERVKKNNEHNPRYDSLSVKDIVNLYDVKPEKPSDVDYKKNIMEIAHPTPVVLFQSHDKINSLVENNNERQTIILNILKKMPNGNLTQKKYAEQELALSLIRLATDMDNQNNEELRILADTCAEQLQKKAFDFKDFISERGDDAVNIGSGAATGAITGGLIGAFIPGGFLLGAGIGAAAGGLIAAISKTSPQAKNVIINAHIADEELKDLIKDHPADPFLHQLDEGLLNITSTATQYAQVVDNMHAPNAGASQRDTAAKIAISYFNELAKLNVLMGTFLQNASEGKYAPDESDWWAKVKSPIKSMFGDDVQDEVGALKTLQSVIKIAIVGINKTKQEAMNIATEAPTEPVQPVQPTAKKSNPESDFFGQLSGISSELDALSKK